jgi:hypothetical protein
MEDIISFLRVQADEIDETADRCNDPLVVSELQHISAQLREKAVLLERP